MDIVRNFVKSLDDYDDYTFNLVLSNSCDAESKIEDSIGIFPFIYFSKVIKVDDNLWFYALDATHQTNGLVASAIYRSLNEDNECVEVVSFRHNCLGDPLETMDWCSKLLEESKKSNVQQPLINDFKDVDNWQGISKYI